MICHAATVAHAADAFRRHAFDFLASTLLIFAPISSPLMPLLIVIAAAAAADALQADDAAARAARATPTGRCHGYVTITRRLSSHTIES